MPTIINEYSDEGGGVKCLGLISGKVNRFKRNHAVPKETKTKIPHMGWNKVTFTRKHPLINGLDNNSYFYFVQLFRESCRPKPRSWEN